VRADAEVRLLVNGEESWAPPAVRDEAFLVTQEAVRNALTHGRPDVLLIEITVTPHELRARVSDDGCGFRLSEVTGRASVGAGLASMRKRAALVHGRLAVSSAPGIGTDVELRVPLAGQDPPAGRDCPAFGRNGPAAGQGCPACGEDCPGWAPR
jgi:signal transduction histidine kinase